MDLINLILTDMKLIIYQVVSSFSCINDMQHYISQRSYFVIFTVRRNQWR